MKGRALIVAAAAVYLAVIGCVIWSSDAPAAKSGENRAIGATTAASDLSDLPYRGFAVQLFQRPDFVPYYEKAVDRIAELGADTVSISVAALQENGASSQIFIDIRNAPTDADLGELIRHAKSKRLRVVLMPIVLLKNPRDNEWRGRIAPESWENWFKSYRELMQHWAGLAEANHVDVLSVGSELVSTEKFGDQWAQVIQDVRAGFKGRLTYSSNWDHYVSIPFWEQLDLIGMNSYWKLGDDSKVTVSQIEQRWKPIKTDLLNFVHKKHKPLMFLEVGWCSIANAASEPWDYTPEFIPLDMDLQRRLYVAFFNTWNGVPELGGYMMWEWTPGRSGLQDRGYTPDGKPAQAVLRENYAVPRWRVMP